MKKVITGVKVHLVPEDEPVILNSYMLQDLPYGGSMEAYYRAVAIDNETVEPIRITRYKILTEEQAAEELLIPEEETIWFYATKDVQHKLGIVYETWNSQQLEVNKYYRFWALPWYKRLWKALRG